MSQSKNLHVQYYALLREQAGLSSETVDSAAHTATELYLELAERHHFSLPTNQLKVAINDQFAQWNTEIQNNDIVIFIPPVAGG